MKPSVALDRKRAAVREAAGCFRTAKPRIFGSVLHGTDQGGSALDLLTSSDLPPRFREQASRGGAGMTVNRPVRVVSGWLPGLL